ncbi:MAG TPA: hypothetical protein VGO64_10270, partial [Candidatus Limnocylindrales bacterium]|nr:hypothetical protein [Candidatus Limnocylindrales bacterium]
HGEPHPDPTEDLAIRWVPFAAALAMIETGELTDALSILGLHAVTVERARGDARTPEAEGDR